MEYITGIDTRIGYPNEHISGESAKLVSRPLFATAVGLMMESDINNSRSRLYVQEHPGTVKIQAKTESVAPLEQKPSLQMNTITDKPQVTENTNEEQQQIDVEQGTSAYIENRFLGKFIKKFKDFIDKAE